MRARFATVVLASLAGLLVAGCTASSVSSIGPQVAPVLAPVIPTSIPPAETLVRATSLMAQQPGYNFSFEITLSGLSETNGAPLAVSGSGTTDLAGSRSRVALNLEGLRDAARLAGESGEEIEAMLGEGTLEFIQDGTIVYLRMPFLAREAGASTPWVSLTMPDNPGPGSSSLPGLFGGLGSAGSPIGYLAQLRAIDATVAEDGTDVVRGVTTTRYRGTLDLGKLLGQHAPAAETGQLQAMMPFFEAFRLPYEVWVDTEGLPRRLATTLDFRSFAPAGVPASEPVPVLTFASDLFDFGFPAAITLPVPSEVTALDPAQLASLR